MAEAGHDLDTPPRKLRRIDEKADRKDKTRVHEIKIDHLPDEVLIIIFSSISFNDLVDNVQNVCTRWKRLAHDPVLWLDKEYIIRARGSAVTGRSCCGVVWSKCIHCRSEGKDEEILRTAVATPQLRKLTLLRSIKAPVLKKIVTYWPNLTVLKINCHQNMAYNLMKHIFEKCPNIWKLKLGSSLLSRQRNAQLLSTLEHLRSLDVFVDRQSLQSVSYRVLARACPRLEEINFRWWEHEVDDVGDFLKAEQDSITSATLDSTVASEKVCVVPMLKQCHRLRKLTLNFVLSNNTTAAEAFEALGELHSLEDLSIECARPQTPELISLAFRPGCLTQLRRLVVMDCSIQDETLVAISRGCPNLRELRLFCPDFITDEGLREIHHLKYLKILEFYWCLRLSGCAMAHVAQLPALHTLVLRSHLLDSLQPGLHSIVDMKELRCLEILNCGPITAVPFDEFPSRLVNLRELRVACDEAEKPFCKTVFAELQRKMPHLRVFNTLRLEDGWDETEDGGWW